MSTGIRHFWIDNAGGLHHVGNQRFQRIFYAAEEVVPEFANRMVPTLQVIYRVERRKPTALINIRGYRIPFDAAGRMDAERQRRDYPWMALMSEDAAKHGFRVGGEPANVVNVEHRIAARRIRREVFFEPTPEQVRAVVRALGIVPEERPTPPRRLRIVRKNEDSRRAKASQRAGRTWCYPSVLALRKASTVSTTVRALNTIPRSIISCC